MNKNTSVLDRDQEKPMLKNLENGLETPNVLRHILMSLLERRRMNEAELSRQTGISPATIHRLISGASPDVRISTLRAIADFFHISIGQLIGSEPIDILEDGATSHKKVLKLPLIPWDKADKWHQLISNYIPTNWSYWTTVLEPISSNCFGLCVDSPNLPPPFMANSILVVDPSAQPKDGDYVIVQEINDGSIMPKRVMYEGSKPWLMSLRKNLPASPLNKEYIICGVVIQINVPLNTPNRQISPHENYPQQRN